MGRITYRKFTAAKEIILKYHEQISKEKRDLQIELQDKSKFFLVKKTDRIVDSNLSTSVVNLLRANGYNYFECTIEDLFGSITRKDLMKTRGFGTKSILELMDLSLHVGMNFKSK